MLTEKLFIRDEVYPSWYVNALGRFLSLGAFGFVVSRLTDTTIQVAAGADDQAAVVAVQGRWRWIEAAVNRVHPGGAAGTYDIYVTALDTTIVSSPDPYTDTTDYGWALAIVTAGATPTIVAGSVEIFRKVGSLQWNGTKITRIDQTVPGSPLHAHRHATGQPDAISPADIGAAAAADLTSEVARAQNAEAVETAARTVADSSEATVRAAAIAAEAATRAAADAGEATTRALYDDSLAQLLVQPGVKRTTDVALSASSVNPGTGQISVTLAAGSPLWVRSATGVLIAVSFAGGTFSLAPSALPAAGQYRGYGVEISTSGAVTLRAAGADSGSLAAALAAINGAAPAGTVRVADVVLLNTAGSYSVAGTRDRRPWAAGAYYFGQMPAHGGAGASVSTTTAGPTQIEPDWQVRLECSGALVEAVLTGAQVLASTVAHVYITVTVDGVPWRTFGFLPDPGAGTYTVESAEMGGTVVAAGSRLFGLAWGVDGGTGQILVGGSDMPLLTLREVLRGNASNGAN